jgi:histone-lysine N-methyltransferase SUV39H
VTWNNDLLHPEDTKKWARRETKRRNSLANDSLDIELWGTLDIHNTATRLRAQAYEEKLKKRNESPINHAQKMAKLLADKLPHTYGGPRVSTVPSTQPGPSLRSRRQTTHDSSVRSMSLSVASSSGSSAMLSSMSHPTPASSATSVSVSAPPPASSFQGKRRAVMNPPALHSLSPAESSIAARMMRALPSRARKAPIPKLSR